MCIFCDIIEGKIPSTKVYENDYVYCFRDINPVTPTHVLVVPKKHFDDIMDIASSEECALYMGEISKGINEVAKIEGLEKGFRVINNCREMGGQTVNHIHFHVLGGVQFTEKMV